MKVLTIMSSRCLQFFGAAAALNSGYTAIHHTTQEENSQSTAVCSSLPWQFVHS